MSYPGDPPSTKVLANYPLNINDRYVSFSMEINKNCAGEDVMGVRSSFKTNDAGDAVDALPSCFGESSSKPEEESKVVSLQPKESNDISPEPKEKSKISVHQCKDDFDYNMNHPKRGYAVIFNHELFDDDLKLARRVGTEVDRSSLRETLLDLKFDVKIHDNLTLKELNFKLDELAAEDFTDCDCLLVVILSHGLDGNYIFAKDKPYLITDLFNRFTPENCKSLAGKPKIFFIQACRGSKLCLGADVEYSNQFDSGISSYQIPLFVDFLFAYSTIPGYYSMRNTSNGTWFIQALCQKLREHWRDYDLQTILTLVNMSVAYDYPRPENFTSASWMAGRKQTSTFTSQLTRILRFSPKT